MWREPVLGGFDPLRGFSTRARFFFDSARTRSRACWRTPARLPSGMTWARASLAASSLSSTRFETVTERRARSASRKAVDSSRTGRDAAWVGGRGSDVGTTLSGERAGAGSGTRDAEPEGETAGRAGLLGAEGRSRTTSRVG